MYKTLGRYVHNLARHLILLVDKMTLELSRPKLFGPLVIGQRTVYMISKKAITDHTGLSGFITGMPHAVNSRGGFPDPVRIIKNDKFSNLQIFIMKNKLKFILPIIALMMAVAGVFAMKATKKIKKFDPVTWYYNGSPDQTSSELNDPANYTTSDPGSECLSSGSKICSIVDDAAPGGTEPALSQGTVSTSNSDYDPGFRQ